MRPLRSIENGRISNGYCASASPGRACGAGSPRTRHGRIAMERGEQPLSIVTVNGTTTNSDSASRSDTSTLFEGTGFLPPFPNEEGPSVPPARRSAPASRQGSLGRLAVSRLNRVRRAAASQKERRIHGRTTYKDRRLEPVRQTGLFLGQPRKRHLTPDLERNARRPLSRSIRVELGVPSELPYCNCSTTRRRSSGVDIEPTCTPSGRRRNDLALTPICCHRSGGVPGAFQLHRDGFGSPPGTAPAPPRT